MQEDAFEVAAVPGGDPLGGKLARERAVDDRGHVASVGGPRGRCRWTGRRESETRQRGPFGPRGDRPRRRNDGPSAQAGGAGLVQCPSGVNRGQARAGGSVGASLDTLPCVAFGMCRLSFCACAPSSGALPRSWRLSARATANRPRHREPGGTITGPDRRWLSFPRKRNAGRVERFRKSR